MVVLALVIALTATIRLRLLDVPLERDEGEYAYAGQLILDGIPPYEGMYNMKLPGIYAAYAGLLALFGESVRGIRFGLLLVNAITTLLLFHLAMRFLRLGGALFAAVTFSLMSLDPAVQGMFANAEHFVILPAAAGLLVLLLAVDDRRSAPFAAAGILLGIALIIKQHGGAFTALGFTIVLVDALGERGKGRPFPAARIFYFTGGVLFVYGITCFIFLIAGAFGNFWHWTVEYARAYISQVPLSQAPAHFTGAVTLIARSSPVLWAWTTAGLVLLFTPIWPGRFRAYLLLFIIFSVAAISPGFYYRPHYFVLLLPAAAILAGGAFEWVRRSFSDRFHGLTGKSVPLIAALLSLLFSVAVQRDFFFQLTPDEVCRRVFGMNPFVESPEIARQIRARTNDDDRIAVIGSEPQIYFYSSRRAATGYIYTYAMMEDHPFAAKMQQEMIAEIEAARPALLVYVRNSHSWGFRDNSPTELLDWFGQYRDEHYRLVGLVSQYTTHSEYHWEKIPWPPTTENWIALLERIDRE